MSQRFDDARHYIPGGVNSPVRAFNGVGGEPVFVARADGPFVWDTDGKRYIEGLAGLWCTSLGFSEKRLIQAATRQMEQLPYMHLFGHRGHEPAVELAERVIAMAPPSTPPFAANRLAASITQP